MRHHLKNIPCKVSITIDAWSSIIYKGYLTTTLHRIDSNWVMQTILLDFVHFPTPHNAESASTLLSHILQRWDLTKRLAFVTTDNANDNISALKLLITHINNAATTYRPVEDIRVRCIAHIVHLGTKYCLHLVHENI